MTPPVPLTTNAAAMLVPISKEEMALLADEQCVQQEMNNLECLLATKHKEHLDLAKKRKVGQMKHKEETKVRASMLAEALKAVVAAVAEVRQAAKRTQRMQCGRQQKSYRGCSPQ